MLMFDSQLSTPFTLYSFSVSDADEPFSDEKIQNEIHFIFLISFCTTILCDFWSFLCCRDTVWCPDFLRMVEEEALFLWQLFFRYWTVYWDCWPIQTVGWHTQLHFRRSQAISIQKHGKTGYSLFGNFDRFWGWWVPEDFGFTRAFTQNANNTYVRKAIEITVTLN